MSYTYFPHKWAHHKQDWVQLEGKPVCVVKTTRTPQGFVWQHGKQYGIEVTLDRALQWAEAAREHYPRHV